MSTFERLLSTTLAVTKEIETAEDGFQRYVYSIKGERAETTCIPDDDDYAIAHAVRECIGTAITDGFDTVDTLLANEGRDQEALINKLYELVSELGPTYDLRETSDVIDLLVNHLDSFFRVMYDHLK